MYTYVHLIFTRGGSRISGRKVQIHARDSLSTFYPVFHKVPYEISRSSCSLKSLCKGEVYEGIQEGIHLKILIYIRAYTTSLIIFQRGANCLRENMSYTQFW